MARIRLAEAADAPSFPEIYAPSVVDSCISFELEVPDAAEFRRRLEAQARVAPWLVCEEAGRVLGYAYGSRHRERAAYRWSTDASVYVAAGARRRGVGRALYRSLFALLALQGFRAVHAGIALPNPPSVGLHEALGFLPVGVYRAVGFKAGRWCDVGWWQLELLPRVGPPPEPLDVAAARALPGWAPSLASGEALVRSG